MSTETKEKHTLYMREWNAKNREKLRSRYAQYKKTYREKGIVKNPKNTMESIWEKVAKGADDECWLWTGPVSGGYGRIQIGFKKYRVHRIIFDDLNPNVIDKIGPIDTRKGGLVLHKCDNKLCCNPSHLYVGTHEQNMKDRLSHGDGYKNLPKGEDHHNSIFSNEDRARLIEIHMKQGIKAKQLALQFNVNYNTVKSILYWHKRNAE